MRKINDKCHYEAVGKDNGVDAYCMKKDTRVEGPIEHGVKPVQNPNKSHAMTAKELLELTDEEALNLAPYTAI